MNNELFKTLLAVLIGAALYKLYYTGKEAREGPPVTPITEQPGQYLVIAGNFATVENATPIVLYLREKGWRTACAMAYGERYRVVVSRHEKEIQAYQTKSELEALQVGAFVITLKNKDDGEKIQNHGRTN